MTKQNFYNFLRLAVDETIFLFYNNFYQQIKGVATGSPLCPFFANSFLCHPESDWINNCPLDFKTAVYKCFLLLYIQPFLNYLNYNIYI